MPDACQSGSDDALRAASISAFAQNFLMLLTGSVIGSASDVYGRRGKFVFVDVCSSALFFTFIFLVKLPFGLLIKASSNMTCFAANSFSM
jgi:hypothetical protein